MNWCAKLRNSSLASLDYEKSFWGFLARQMAPFLVGVLIATLLGDWKDALLQGVAAEERAERTIFYLILLLLASLSISVLVIIYVYDRLYRISRSTRRFSVTIDRDHHRSGRTHRMAFNRCLGEALNARRNITVLSPHFPQAHMDPNVALETETGTRSPEGHDSYLEKGMEEVLDRHIIDRQSDFTYTRVVQVDSQTELESMEFGEVDFSMFGNKAMAKHVDTMIKKNGESHTANVRAYARRFVPSFPSTLVIDDQFIFFSLPTYLSSGTRDGRNTLDFDCVVGIEDKDGEIPRIFRQFITQFEIAAQEIKAIKFGREECDADVSFNN